MRRPLCLLCLLFVLFVMVLLPLFFPSIADKTLPENRTRIEFTGEVHEIESGGGKSVLHLKNRKQKLSVLCYMSEDISGLKIGNTVRVSGKVRHFEPATNDGQFDAKLYYAVLHIDYAMSDCEWILTDSSYHPFFQMIHQVKTKLGKSLDAGLTEDDAGVLKAMLLGDKKSMTPSVKGLYQRNGIAHILAVSGLHITLWGMGLCRLLKRLYMPLSIANLFSFLFVIFYGILTGSQASAVRSIIMFSLFLLAPVVRRTYDMMTAMSLSAALLLFLNPLYIYHSGFLLSFAAVAGIALLLPCLTELFSDDSLIKRMVVEEETLKNKVRKKLTGFLRSSVSVSLSVTLATLPLQIYFFYTVPVYSVVLNLLIAPLVGCLMVLGMCGAVLGCLLSGLSQAGRIFLYPCHIILVFYKKICAVFDGLPMAHPTIAKPAVWRVVMYYAVLAGAIFLIKKRMEKRKEIPADIKYETHKGIHRVGKERVRIVAAGALAVNIVLLCLNPRFCTRITMLDVGQGDCFVIEEKSGRTIMIDGGSSSVSEVGKYRIIPFLKSHGIDRLDYVFLSHSDSDHVNGVSEILQDTENGAIKVNCLVLTDSVNGVEGYRELLSVCAKKGVKTAFISEGDYLDCGELSFFCLYPEGSVVQVGISKEPGRGESGVQVGSYGESDGGESGVQADSHGESDGENKVDANDSSMVLLLECGDFEMLFTGDLSSERESAIRLTDRNGNKIEYIDVLKAAHHGSKYSTSADFLQALSPKAALVSAGRENRYGHPHKETVERLEKQGCRVLRTDESGQITIRVKKGKFMVQRYLEQGTNRQVKWKER